MRTRAFLLTGLVVALLLAGVASYYASAHPDGLNHVAEKAGFGDAGDSSRAADGPLAGYQTEGIEDDRVSGGVAGVAGSLLVLGIGGGLFWLLRRRSPDGAEPDAEQDAEGAAEPDASREPVDSEA